MKQSRNSFRNVGDFLARLKGEVSNKLPWKERDDDAEADAAEFDVDTAQLSDEELRAFWFGEKVPGVVGLRNHGNTCFINAVLQCLSHTDTFAEYFATEKYKVDLMQRNRLKSRKFGTQGEVTEKLAEVIKAVWSCQYTQAITTEFKSTIDKYGSQYRGSTQHDAQEFLLWLLDKVHEDLNVAKKQKYKRLKSSSDRPDEVLAAESMANFLRCNESFVQGLFQAQFRSSLTCPHCQRQSNTFDPFLCLSLPIPQSPRRPVFVAVVYLRQQPRQVRLAFSMDCAATVGDLRNVISADAGICSDQLVLVEIDGEGFHRTFFDEQPLSVIDSKDLVHSLYAIEMPEQPEKSADEGESVSIIFVNVLSLPDPSSKQRVDDTKGEGVSMEDAVADDPEAIEADSSDVSFTQTRFGAPYVTQMRRETSYVDFQKLLLKEMQMMVHPSVLCAEQEVPLFKVELYLGEKDCQVLSSNMEMPLYAEAVDQALSLSDPDGDGHAGPKHIKLLLKWGLGPKEKVIFDDVEHEDEHESVKELREDPNYHPPVQLEQCFAEYTSDEVLGQDNAWLCPSCNRREKGVKRLALWSLPDILIVHLKRFKQSTANGMITTKLTTLVEFPKTDFNISDHLVKHDSSPRHSNAESSRAEASGGSSSSASTPDENGVAGFDLVLSKASKTLSVVSEWPKAILGRNKRQSLPVKTSHPSLLKPEECSYNLYAVCNHHGSGDQGGHYTAFCRNSNNGLWYCFDDQQVTRVDDSELVTKDAYILFYQRKTKAPRYGIPSMSVGGSSTLPHSFPFPSSLGRFAAGGGKPGDRLSGTLPPSWQFRQHHWVYRIPGLKPVGATTNGKDGASPERENENGKDEASKAACSNGDQHLASSESMSDSEEERGNAAEKKPKDMDDSRNETTTAQNLKEKKADES